MSALARIEEAMRLLRELVELAREIRDELRKHASAA